MQRRDWAGTVLLACLVALAALLHNSTLFVSLFGAAAFLSAVLIVYDVGRRKLPWEIRRKDASDLPDWLEGIPYFLNPKNDRRWCANHLIEYGHAVRNRIPQGKEPSAIAQALVGSPIQGPNYFREVVYWEQDVHTFLSVRARECQALFRRGPISHNYSGLRAYMDERLKELTMIHGRLSG